MMNDEQFLQAIISAVTVTSNGIPDQMVGIKDLHSAHRYCSQCFADALGVSVDHVIGSTFCTGEILDIVISEDQKVFQSRKPQAFLKIDKFHHRIKPLVFIKSPIVNPNTQNVVGLLLQVFEYGIRDNFHQQVGGLYKVFFAKAKQVSTIKLSKREKQVIFFFLAHLSSQEIAETLYKLENKRVTKSTIDSIFTDQLYLKFKVTNRIALHQKLLELGYHKLIPQEILTNSSTPLEVAEVY